jgi:hypothetical protein
VALFLWLFFYDHLSLVYYFLQHPVLTFYSDFACRHCLSGVGALLLLWDVESMGHRALFWEVLLGGDYV